MYFFRHEFYLFQDSIDLPMCLGSNRWADEILAANEIVHLQKNVNNRKEC